MPRLDSSQDAVQRNGLQRQPWGAAKKALQQNEKKFQQQVMDFAQDLNWWPWHAYNAMRSPAGWPDLVLFRERVVFVELKARDAKGRMGRVRAEQIDMAHRCFAAGAEYYLWTPDDWIEITDVLTRGSAVRVVALDGVRG